MHESFPTFRTDWSALAVATDTTSQPTCGVDPGTGLNACGEAYILIAGSSIVVNSLVISVTPLDATNPVGTNHTVTANVHAAGGTPAVVGQLVDFTVTGQNAGATGTCAPADCKSDVSGNVTFTYRRSGAGDDTIKASFTDAAGSLQTATAQKHWEGASRPTPTLPTIGAVRCVRARHLVPRKSPCRAGTPSRGVFAGRRNGPRWWVLLCLWHVDGKRARASDDQGVHDDLAGQAVATPGELQAARLQVDRSAEARAVARDLRGVDVVAIREDRDALERAPAVGPDIDSVPVPVSSTTAPLLLEPHGVG